ncbi:MAG: hypothetical protein IPI60_17770 [Saprospiraceae bacterium]|nr:hypothetical protein [Saprospiraceae bacterium]
MELSDSEKYFLLKEQLQSYLGVLNKALEKINDAGATTYPIFVIHQDAISLGLPIIQRSVNGGRWNIHFSTLEEFVAKRLIRTERIEEFQALYAKHEGEFCLFVLSELGASFVFIPKV